MAAAMQSIGELKGACRRLQNPYILIRPLQRREALTSSAMEGTFTTTDRLLLAEAGVEEPQDESTREVVNYLTALNAALAMLRELPLSHRIIRRSHEILLSGLGPLRGARKRPGEYKIEQNWIGGYTIDTARFVPPPPAETQQCMDALERYINRDGADGPARLIDLALVHYQFEAIHPFADGNGRVGRMLITAMAVHSGLLDMPALYMSPVLERQKDTYIDHLYNVSVEGEWSNWLNFFFDRVAESCAETVRTIDRLLELQDIYRQRTAATSRSANAITIVDLLFEQPLLTVRDAQQKLGVTYRAASKTLDKLVDLGILTPFPNAYPKMYLATEITEIPRKMPESASE
jgi:Fic family protein